MLVTGVSIPAPDLMIAATAIANGYDVITLDSRHFDRVPGLTVQLPDW
jgi:predicted nucleic acid-binding protein